MRAEPLTDAAGHLADLADEVEATRGRVVLTRPGHADIVLLSADDLASMEETVELAGDPSAQREIAEADAAYARGDYVTGDELRARYGLPPRVADPYRVHVAGPAWRCLDRLPDRVVPAVVEFITGRREGPAPASGRALRASLPSPSGGGTDRCAVPEARRQTAFRSRWGAISAAQ